ncbi:MAG TPA: nucleotide kinase domain-containing protein [Candidatus Paceibacterota bacterium]
MEIPHHLKELYRHWESHVVLHDSPAVEEVFTDAKLFKEVEWFIHERIHIWEQKVTGAQPPYTQDPIFSKYRFCNILREFDRQTIEFHTLLNPLRDNFPLWLLNMFYCRMVARIETIQYAGLLSFNNSKNKKVYERLMNSPRPRFGTPYVFPVSVIQKSSTPTRELFITEYLPAIMQTVADEITAWENKSVIDGLTQIIPLFKFNLHFLWTEVLIDVAYQFPQYIDLFEEFPVGPGSLPTMQRINSSIKPSLLVQQLGNHSFDAGLTYNNKLTRLSAENWEGIGCEFRKYTNLSQGLGRKRLFR